MGKLIFESFVFATVCTVTGLVAMWVTFGKPHWFLRVVVLGGVLSLTLAIPADEMLLILFTQSVAAVLTLLLFGGARTRARTLTCQSRYENGAFNPSKPQCSLQDLLLFTVVVASIAAVATHMPMTTWRAFPKLALLGFGCAICTVVGTWAALGRSRLSFRVIVLCLIPPAALIAAWLALARASGYVTVTSRRGNAPANDFARSVATKSPNARLFKVACVLLTLFILLPPALVYCVLVTPIGFPPQIALPNPNGYDDLVWAGEHLDGAMIPYDDAASEAELRRFVTQNSEAFATARVGLDRECCVPIAYDASSIKAEYEREAAVRDMGLAFIAEGRLAEMERKTVRAMRSYLDASRLSCAGARGGLLVNLLGGWAVEEIAMDRACRLRKSLTSEECRDLIPVLQAIDANREPVSEGFARERMWGRRTEPWRGRLSFLFDWITKYREIVKQEEYGHRARTCLLICELGLRSYRLEQGGDPVKLDELVPDHLPALPVDPFTGNPPVYRRTSTGYQLYCVGPNGRDDGGQPTHHAGSPDDVMLFNTTRSMGVQPPFTAEATDKRPPRVSGR